MKPSIAILAGLVFITPPAGAQVTINRAALDQLAGIPPSVVTAPPAIRQTPRRIAYRRVIHRHAVAVAAASRPVPKPAAMPQPAPPRLVSAAPPPLRQPPPTATIIFAAGAPDLPPGIAAQLKPFCTHPASGHPLTIDAYAAADPSDPSAALRLSMSRAFALRNALVACGISAAAIIPRADGDTGHNPDRAEVAAQ